MKALTLKNVLIFAAMATAFAQPQSPQPKPAQTPAGSMPGPPPNMSAPPRIVPGTSAGAPAAVNVAPDAVVLTIGSRKMTRAQFEEFASKLPEQLKVAVNGPNRRRFIEQYAELEALAQQARDRKLDQKPAVQAIVALQTDQALAGQLVQDLTANIKPDDAAIKAYYEAHKAEYAAPEVKARHILIRFKGSAVPLRAGEKELTEEEALARAKELREKIVKGADFGALAKAESDDTGSGANGGDLGSFGHGRMVKEFDEVAFSLPVGEISQPVKSQFGYHIIQVESRGPKSFEDLKPQIEPKLKAEMSKKAIDDAKKQTPVVINDEYFGKQD
jgi:peptidyl-prolyl cis-trans isomerase C